MPFFLYSKCFDFKRSMDLITALGLVITMCSNAHFYLQVADPLKSASNSLDNFVDISAHI